MARPRSYERDEAVARVRDAFWRHGYGALGIRAIEEETGLGRFAIRTVFGGKEGLMLAAMDAYREDTETYVLAPLRARSDSEALVEVLEAMVAPHPETMRGSGCLMVNTAIEGDAAPDALKAAVTDHFGALRAEVVALVGRAQAEGAVRTDLDPAEAAEFVTGSVMAINVLNRTAGDPTAAAGYVAQAVRAIRGWAV